MAKKVFNILLVVYVLISVSFLCVYSQEKDDVIYIDFLGITKLALENNLDIQMAKFDAYINRNNLFEAESIFDTFFNAQLSYEKNNLDAASTLLGSSSSTSNYSVGITKKMPTGTTIGIEAYNRRIWSNSTFYSLNPNTEANVGISLTQPLAKNFFGFTDRTNIKITKLNITNSDFTSLDNIEAALAGVQKAYWEVVLRYEELQIKKDMLNEAKKLYEIYKKKVNIGLVEEPDVLAARANVFSKKSDVLSAQLLFNEAKNNLLYLLNIKDTDKKIIPLDRLDVKTRRFNLYDELKEAVETRRDYRIVKNQVSASSLDVALKKNSLWPQIDLVSSFTKNGISLNYKDAWSKVSSDDYSSWSIGVNISFPLERRKEKSYYNKAKLNKAKLLLLLKKTERLIFREINNSVTQINSLANRIEALKSVVELQKKKLVAEKIRLKYGRSSSDIIIRYQNDVLNSRLMLSEALFSYRIAVIELERNKNTLLFKYWKQKI